ncbi:MAG: hydantoin utilization protein A [Synechococcus sp. BS307-5m-G38]|nr:hydantoin utilization protein A [Cyanobium sp. MED843]MBL6802211.1 hydantoin utilization protein A [Synechococcus sp. BS307-5m-G38]
MLISVLTGFAAGAVHVVGGADHLVAMAPFSLRKPWPAMRAGLAWGAGHSTGVVVLALVAIAFKDLAHIEAMSAWAEFLVGVALLVVGVLAVRTAFGLELHSHEHRHDGVETHQHLHLHVRGQSNHRRHAHAASGLGLLHGLAGASHLLAVIPALALPPLAAVGYLVAYLCGSIGAMLAVVAVVSLLTFRSGARFLPWLVGGTGALSIFTGAIWLQRTSSALF